MGASSASAINMMDTMDDHVYCNSTTATPAAPVTSVASPSQVATSTTTTATTTVAEMVKATEPCDPAHFQQSSSTSSPSQYSPAPSSPHPSSPQPSASPRPSSPIQLSSGPGSPAPSSPVPSLEDDTLMMEDDGAEAEAAYEPEQVQQHPVAENEAEAELCANDVYEYRVPEGDTIDPGEIEYGDDEEEDEQEANENGRDDDDERNTASDNGVLSDDQQGGDDPNDGNSQLDGMAAALVAMKEVKQLQSILLLHLDLIQEQGDQILNKDKMIIRLKDENEVLKHQLDLANRRVSLMMLQLQQNGLALPGDHLQQQHQQHQQQQQQPQHHHQFLLQQPHDLPPAVKQEGTVSPLTIRNQLENGRMRPVVLKSSSSSSSSPPFVSSSVTDGVALYGVPGCLPIRNPEVSSTVSPVKEELPDDIVLQNDALSSSPFYNDEEDDDDDDDDGDGDEEAGEEDEEEEDEEEEDGDGDEEDGDGDDEGGEEYRTDNNEVDGEIYLNYSKSDDDESLSPQMHHAEYDEEQQQQQQQLPQPDVYEEEPNVYDDHEHQLQQEQQHQYLLLQQQAQLQQAYTNYDGELQQPGLEEDEEEEQEEDEEEDEEEEEEEEMGYEGTQGEEGEDSVGMMHPYAGDPAGNVVGYDDTPMVMIDEGAVEVKMETNSPGSQQDDSQEESQDSLQQAQSQSQSLDVHVPFVESTSLGSEGSEAPEEEEEEPSLEAARSTEPATMEYEPCSESTEDGTETRRGPGHQTLRGGGRTVPPAASHPFNPSLHCPSGNSSDGSSMATGSKRHCRPNPAYMVTQKEYISCAWKDDAVTAELEKLLTNEAAELEIPSWTVIEDDEDDDPAGDDPADPVSASEGATVRENISDEAYAKRHTKLEIDERRRKKWDVQRIREQKNIERLKKRQLKDQPVEQEAPKTITTLYPTVDTLKYIQVTEDVPVQAFGELIPVLSRCHGYGFSLPWHQVKAGPSFANPSPGVLLPSHHHHHPHHHHLLNVETKTKFLHRLAPSLQQAQKQRFTKRLKKEL